jgi:hypothetical protein
MDATVRGAGASWQEKNRQKPPGKGQAVPVNGSGPVAACGIDFGVDEHGAIVHASRVVIAA